MKFHFFSHFSTLVFAFNFFYDGIEYCKQRNKVACKLMYKKNPIILIRV